MVDGRMRRRLKGGSRVACQTGPMAPPRPTPRGPHCVLCISCMNFVRREDGEEARACLAGAEPDRVLFECESYVRRLGRAPDVPARYRQNPA